MPAPEVLLGGNHADIVAWRREQSLALTLARRPELLENAPLDAEDHAMLARLRRAGEVGARLNEFGVPHQRLELRQADLWPKRWLDAFVPPKRRKAARKQCISGRRHVGYLWQAFSMGFIPERARGDAAWQAWRDGPGGGCLLLLQEDGLLFDVPDASLLTPEILRPLGCAVLADAALTRTLALTGRAGDGAYYGEAGGAESLKRRE